MPSGGVLGGVPGAPGGPAQRGTARSGRARRACQDLSTRAFQRLWVPHGSREVFPGLPARVTDLSPPAPPSPEQSLPAASLLASAKPSLGASLVAQRVKRPPAMQETWV